MNLFSQEHGKTRHRRSRLGLSGRVRRALHGVLDARAGKLLVGNPSRRMGLDGLAGMAPGQADLGATPLVGVCRGWASQAHAYAGAESQPQVSAVGKRGVQLSLAKFAGQSW